MAVTTLEPPDVDMAKRKDKPPAGPPKRAGRAVDRPVRIDEDLADAIEMILRWRRKVTGRKPSTSEYLSPIVRKGIRADYEQARQFMNASPAIRDDDD